MFEAYQYITNMHITPIVIWVSLAIAILSVVLIKFLVNNNRYRYISIAILFVWIFLYLCEAVIFRDSMTNCVAYLHPVYFIKPLIENSLSSVLGYLSYMTLVFVPIGVLLSFIFHFTYPDKKRYGRVVMIGLAISCLIESLQYFFNKGDFYTSDIIFNVLGCLFGTAIHKLYFRNLWVHEINKRISDKHCYYKKIKCQIFIGEIKREKFIWIILVFALLLPFISYSSLGINSDVLHRLHILCDNLAYSYIAGFVIYGFTIILPRIENIFKAKRHLASAFGSIYSDMVCIADSLGYYDNGGEENNDKVKTMKRHLVVEKAKETPCGILKTVVKDFLGIHNHDKICSNEVILNKRAVGIIKAMSALIQTDVDNALRCFSNGMTEDEIKHLNDFKDLSEKLFYTSLAGYVYDEEIRSSANDVDYYVNEFCNKLSTAKRLKGQYSKYNYYAVHKDAIMSTPEYIR